MCDCYESKCARRLIVVLCLLGLVCLACVVWTVHPLLSVAAWFSGAPAADYWS